MEVGTFSGSDVQEGNHSPKTPTSWKKQKAVNGLKPFLLLFFFYRNSVGNFSFYSVSCENNRSIKRILRLEEKSPESTRFGFSDFGQLAHTKAVKQETAKYRYCLKKKTEMHSNYKPNPSVTKYL